MTVNNMQNKEPVGKQYISGHLTLPTATPPSKSWKIIANLATDIPEGNPVPDQIKLLWKKSSVSNNIAFNC